MADEERLVVALEARVRDFEKNFSKAQATANKRLGAIEKRAERSAANLKEVFAKAGESINLGLSTLGVGGFAVGGGIAGAAGLVGTLKGVASSISEMSAEAKKSGIAVEPFQELSYAAQQAKVSTDALSDGLKEMQLRAEEFVFTGQGSGAEAFQRLGYTADQLKEKLKDPAVLFEEIIDRLKQFDKAAQIRISDEVFGGTGGEQFVRFLEQGRKSIAESRTEARELGVVMDSSTVKKAEELDAKFNQLSLTIETRLKGGVVNVASAFDEWAASVQSFLTKVGNWDGWAKLSAGYAPPAGVTKIDPNDPMSAARAKLAAGLGAGQTGPLRKGSSEDWVWTPDPNAGKPPPKKTATKNTYDYDDLHTASQQRLTDLQTEQTALGMTTERAAAYRFEQEAIATAKAHDITLTPQQTTQLQALAAQYGRVTAQIEQTRMSQQRMQELQQELGSLAMSSISGLIDGTKSWNDVLADTLDLLAQMILKAALLGEGPLAGGGSSGGGGLLGTIVGGVASLFTGGMGGGIGLFANGGVMTPQGPRRLKRYAGGGVSKEAGIFGEAGPEAAVPLPDGRRIPVEMRVPETSKMAGMYMTATTTNHLKLAPVYNNTFSGDGSQASGANFQRAMEKNNMDLERMVKSILVDDLRAQGSFSRALQGRFGLNPMRGV